MLPVADSLVSLSVFGTAEADAWCKEGLIVSEEHRFSYSKEASGLLVQSNPS